MTRSLFAFGILFTVIGIGWIIRSAIGIKRKQLATYGRGGRRREHHGHLAVREGYFQILVGFMFLLFGLFWLFSAATHA